MKSVQYCALALAALLGASIQFAAHAADNGSPGALDRDSQATLSSPPAAAVNGSDLQAHRVRVKTRTAISAKGKGDWSYADEDTAHGLAKRDCWSELNTTCKSMSGGLKSRSVEYAQAFCSTRVGGTGSKQYQCALSCTAICRH